MMLATLKESPKYHIPYSAKFWRGKTLANRSFQSLGKENVGEFTAIYISHFSESGIWLGKILANDVSFAKVFPARILRYTVHGRTLNPWKVVKETMYSVLPSMKYKSLEISNAC